MDYEKLYKEANKKVAVRFGFNVAKELFPDLYESKDERIRKEIIKETKSCEVRLFETVTNDEFVAWLEKQGEQKWKPTEEQLSALKEAFNKGSITFHDMEVLAGLYQTLIAL